MTIKNEPLTGIQALIEELQSTISEKEEHIKERARRLKDELKDEISPLHLVKRHPFEAAGTSFLAGLLLTTALRSRRSPSVIIDPQASATSHFFPVTSKNILFAIGLEVMRSVKDLGFTYIRRYLDKKIR